MAPQDIGSTVEISNVAPTLRDDLKFSLQQHGDQVCYLIEDEKNSRFYRVGIPEYTFISLMDGTTSVREAMAHTAALLGEEAFTENDAATICKWLIDSQLALTEASRTSGRLLEMSDKAYKAKQAEWLNPIILRLPLMRPDRLVTWCTDRFGWCMGWGGFVVWLAVVITAIHQLLTNWESVESANTFVWAPGNLLCMAVFWCLLKVVHELAHGISCKRFGGHVREAGVVLIALAPIPYVDVTSSWRFKSKWKRMFVAAAGMYVELFVAALATLVWIHAEPGLMRQQAYNLMITASLITLIFNANPLMRFDGYYMLSDWLGIPNLYGLGQHYTQYLGRRYFAGVKAKLPQWTFRKALYIKTYGVAAFVWRIVVCAGLLVLAATMFEGAGIVLAILGLGLWITLPLIKLGKYLVNGNEREKPNRMRFVAMVAVTASIVGGLLFCPEPGGVRAPAVVVYEPLNVIRAPHSGFVREIRTTSGATVEEDQVLMVIESKELELEALELTVERAQSVFRTRQFRKDGDVAAAKVEAEMRNAIESRLDERREQLQKSEIRSPVAGQVVQRDIQSLMGTYVTEGQMLLAIGDEMKKELEVSISQDDVDSFEEHAGEEVDVFILSAGQDSLDCALGSTDPRASRELPDSSLAAINGGPLAVKPAENDDDGDKYELIEPRFVGKVALDEEQSQRLKSGQTTTVRLRVARGNLGQYVYRNLSKWLDTRLRQAQES